MTAFLSVSDVSMAFPVYLVVRERFVDSAAAKATRIVREVEAETSQG